MVRELLSAAGADGEDSESQRRRENVGDPDGLGSNRANGPEESTGSSGGSLDIKGFFDNLDHDLMMKAVRNTRKSGG